MFKNYYDLRLSTKLKNESVSGYFSNDFCVVDFSFAFTRIQINTENISFLHLYRKLIVFHGILNSFCRFKYIKSPMIQFLFHFFYLTIQNDKLGVSFDTLYNKAYNLFTFFIMKKEWKVY